MMSCAEHEETHDSTSSTAPEALTVVDPLRRPGWDSLVEAHPQSSVFHGSGWARVLAQSYGHTPMYVCRFRGGQLVGLLPLMGISSPVTGRRGVSLPFTDFCPALKERGQDGHDLYQFAVETGRARRWKYLECRGDCRGWVGSTTSLSFYGHIIDLAGGEQAVFNRFDSAVRRGVRKAEAAGLKVDFSSEPEAIETFFDLHCGTRRRHGLPPQPFRFFENIQRHLLQAGRGFVATVRLNGQPLASGVFFSHGREALYKFGASDFAFQQHRPNNLMMWGAMRHCIARGNLAMHLGRTSLGNDGLRRFKLSLGAREETVQYSKYDFLSEKFVSDTDKVEGWFNHVFRALPLPLLRVAGRVLYPHLT